MRYYIFMLYNVIYYIYRCPTISPRNVPFLLWAQVGNSSSESDELQPLSTGLDLRFEGKCEVASVDASKHHRMDINDTPGSIRGGNLDMEGCGQSFCG